MANPRNIRFYDGLDYHGTTYALDGSSVFTQVPAFGTNHSPQIGLAVALVANAQAGLGASGGALLGKLIAVDPDANGTVQDRGYAQFSYPLNDATAPAVGSPVMVNGAGMVLKATAGLNRVISVDTVNLLCIVQLV